MVVWQKLFEGLKAKSVVHQKTVFLFFPAKRLEDGVNFLGTEIATIVKGVRVFGKGFATVSRAKSFPGALPAVHLIAGNNPL